MLEIRPNERVLELGGGDNPTPGVHVNVDIRPGPATSFTANFDEPLPISSNEWDVVISRFCIEHLSWRKVRQFVREVHRILRPGGRVFIITANTEAQFQFIRNNPRGWDGKDPFESYSCILFGDQDYPDNTHKNFMSPELCHELFESAGFERIVTSAFGERSTDLFLLAYKSDQPSMEETPSIVVPEKPPEPSPVPDKPFMKYSTSEMYDKHYFNGGQKVGGYAHMGYMDFPVHHFTTKHILDRKPTSVLELGCARGYILKRVKDAGIPGIGLEVSRHCIMTRVCEDVHHFDICGNAPWGINSVDLAYSVAVFEHIPESRLGLVLQRLKQHSQRGLHGIDFGEKDDGFDKTHVNLHPRSWWRDRFDENGLQSHEIVDKEELEKGTIWPGLLEGDGKLKLNIGSYTTMFHHGWINIDIHDVSSFATANGFRFQQSDIRNGIAYGTGDVDMIYSSHMLEHLSYEDGLRFLKECRRVLKPGGVMRLLVPDASLLTQWFFGDTIRDPNHFDEINDECERARTPVKKLYSLLHANHLSMYDWETIEEALSQVGFDAGLSSLHSLNGSSTGHQEAQAQLLRETHDMFPCLSLIVNAVPK